MAKTRAQLRALVKKILRLDLTGADDDSELVTNVDINDMLDSVRSEILTEVSAVFPEYFATRATQSFGADAEYILLDAALRDSVIFEVQVRASAAATVDAQRRLVEASVREFFKGALGDPTHYGLLGNNLYLWPTPSGDQTLIIYYVPAVVELADDTATPTELPPDQHDLVAYAAANRFKAIVEDPVANIETIFERKLGNLRKWLDARYRNNSLGG